MSLTYKESPPRRHAYSDGWDTRPDRPDRYDAKIGPFFVGAQDNGEGVWNWWIAFAEQGPAPGEHDIVDSGATLSWEVARRDIERALRDIADNILKELT